jgi:hypothetical protein
MAATSAVTAHQFHTGMATSSALVMSSMPSAT